MLKILAVAAMVFALAPAAADYTQSVAPVSATQAQFTVTPTTPAALVDVHYLNNGANQQNFRMANNGGVWQKTVDGLSAGNVLSYWFTYEKGGPLYDTPHFSYTQGGSGGGGGGGGAGAGTFPLTLKNNTGGKWSNSQVYVMVLGQVTPGQWSYLKADGSMTHISHLDATAPNHLAKNGVNYANMAFTMAQASTISLPASMYGGRIYVSLGTPMYIPISPDDNGWGGPDLRYPSDPNGDVYFDWYEYTYVNGITPFGGNTTQVDMFGFPMTARLQQTAIGYDQTVGIAATRAQVMSQYTASVGAAFSALENPYRIVAPRSSNSFWPGGAQANYLQPYIDQVWNQYTATQFTLTRLGVTFTGRVVNGQLQFTRNGVGPFVLGKPSTTDVVQCAGALANGTMTDTARELGAEFCAAFNRGVAQNTANWYNPAAYYTNSVQNDYAKFFHSIGIDHRSYAFAYDDINDQSSVKILGNNTPPSALTLGIGW